MGLRGPAPTPTRILALRGSNRAGRDNSAEPSPAVELPPAPEWLSEEAKKAYAAVGDRLVAVGVVTALDGETLALFSIAWARLRRCEEILQKHGEVYVIPGKKEGAPAVGFRPYPQAKMALELSDRLVRLRDGVFDDPSFLPVIYEASPDDDFESPAVWRKANPNLGVSVKEDYLERERARAKESPAYLNTFLRLHLNVRTNADCREQTPDSDDGSSRPSA